MRSPLVPWLALALLVAAGCRSRSDLVEAELRTKDRQLREMKAELMRSETMNEALENTLRDQRGAQPVARSGPGPLSQIKDVQLGRGTGGLDEDHIPGDEGLQIVLVPHDLDGSAIKAAGSLKVTAMEVTPEGLKVPLSTWDVSAQKLRQTWRNGLLSTGYFVPLPWQKLPSMEKLRIVATFLPLDGGAFEAEKDVTIHLPPEAQRLRPPPTGLMPPTPLGPMPGAVPPTPLGPMPGTVPPTPLGPMPGTVPPSLPPPEPLPGNSWVPVLPSAELLPPRPGF